MSRRVGFGVAGLLCAALWVLPGCGKNTDYVSQQFSAAGAIVQDHNGSKVAWTVDQNGNVRAAVKGKDGKPITKDLSGELKWEEDGKEKTTKLELDKKTGLLQAKRVDLPSDGTDVKYELKVKGDEMKGDLEVPKAAARPRTVFFADSEQKEIEKDTAEPPPKAVSNNNDSEGSANGWEPLSAKDEAPTDTKAAAEEKPPGWKGSEEPKAVKDDKPEGWKPPEEPKAVKDDKPEGWKPKEEPKAVKDDKPEGWKPAEEPKAVKDDKPEGWTPPPPPPEEKAAAEKKSW